MDLCVTFHSKNSCSSLLVVSSLTVSLDSSQSLVISLSSELSQPNPRNGGVGCCAWLPQPSSRQGSRWPKCRGRVDLHNHRHFMQRFFLLLHFSHCQILSCLCSSGEKFLSAYCESRCSSKQIVSDFTSQPVGDELEGVARQRGSDKLNTRHHQFLTCTNPQYDNRAGNPHRGEGPHAPALYLEIPEKNYLLFHHISHVLLQSIPLLLFQPGSLCN